MTDLERLENVHHDVIGHLPIHTPAQPGQVGRGYYTHWDYRMFVFEGGVVLLGLIGVGVDELDELGTSMRNYLMYERTPRENPCYQNYP